MNKIFTILSLLAGITPSYGYETPPLQGENDTKQLLRTDQVWEYYHKQDISYYPDPEIIRHELKHFVLGEPQEKYGKTYYPVIYRDCLRWDITTYKSGESSMTDAETVNDGSIVGLLREEAGKVFILIESVPPMPPLSLMAHPEENASEHYVTYFDGQFGSMDVIPGQEAILYDFTAEEGQTLRCWLRLASIPTPYWVDVMADAPVYSTTVSETTNTALREITVIDTPNLAYISWQYNEDIEITAQNAREYGAVYVEGVGSIGHGLLCSPGGKMQHPGPEFKGQEPVEMFNNLYDLQGNVLYPGLGVQSPTAGISSIEYSDVNSHKTFDMMGREVKSTQPGGIYIRAGRKFVGK